MSDELTVHELLLLQSNGKARIVPFQVECHDMKASTAVVTLNSQGASLVLHREVAPNRSRTVAYEVVRLGEPDFLNQLVEEVV